MASALDTTDAQWLTDYARLRTGESDYLTLIPDDVDEDEYFAALGDSVLQELSLYWGRDLNSPLDDQPKMILAAGVWADFLLHACRATRRADLETLERIWRHRFETMRDKVANGELVLAGDVVTRYAVSRSEPRVFTTDDERWPDLVDLDDVHG